ncbi:MAG: TIGR01459 family HAD-type hydrolase [Pseudomonadota bacterium]|nr:TIGR01459 family HAD-type hydrolase [Pseudomonadota bacterium]
MSFLDPLPERYRVILCDVWGCIHDGMRLYPGAARRLRQWHEQGRSIVLVSNAPRPASTVEAHLLRLGLHRTDWDYVVTSGETGIAALKGFAAPVGFLGTASDRADLEHSGIRIAGDGAFDQLACVGLDRYRRHSEEYRSELQQLAERGVVMHCLNPDRVVIHGGVEVPCAGALADLYEELGGQVEWYGKPFPPIYHHALGLVGDPPAGAVLAIGDSLATDVLGAARMGFDCVFVSGGIHRGEPFPDDFAAENALGDWRPVAILDSLQ